MERSFHRYYTPVVSHQQLHIFYVTSNSKAAASGGVQPMKFGVIHDVTDPESFTEQGTKLLEDAPEGVRNHQVCPAQDLETCVCIWEADSDDQLREYVDTSLGDASTQEYFAIQEEEAVGLPG